MWKDSRLTLSQAGILVYGRCSERVDDAIPQERSSHNKRHQGLAPIYQLAPRQLLILPRHSKFIHLRLPRRHHYTTIPLPPKPHVACIIWDEPEASNDGNLLPVRHSPPKEHRLGRWDLPIENSGCCKCPDRYLGSGCWKRREDWGERRQEGQLPIPMSCMTMPLCGNVSSL